MTFTRKLLLQLARLSFALAAGVLVAFALTGCVVVGASSTGGWFIWPSGLGLIVIVLLAIFLLRGRRRSAASC